MVVLFVVVLVVLYYVNRFIKCFLPLLFHVLSSYCHGNEQVRRLYLLACIVMSFPVSRTCYRNVCVCVFARAHAHAVCVN